MKDFIKQRLNEILNVPNLRIPTQVSLTNSEIEHLRKVDWRDLKIDDLGGSGNIAHLSIEFPFKTNATKGIIVDIQVIHNMIYQIHIHMANELQKLGLGYKIYKAIINEFGHLYSGKGRRLNSNVSKIWDKLKQDPEITCVSNENGDLCMNKNNPDYEKLTKFIK